MDIDLADCVWLFITMLAAGMLERVAHHLVDQWWNRTSGGSDEPSFDDLVAAVSTVKQELDDLSDRLDEMGEKLDQAVDNIGQKSDTPTANKGRRKTG